MARILKMRAFVLTRDNLFVIECITCYSCNSYDDMACGNAGMLDSSEANFTKKCCAKDGFAACRVTTQNRKAYHKSNHQNIALNFCFFL